MTPFTINRLRCEYLVNPLGIDEHAPRLSWAMNTDRRGARQSAWRVQVASSPDLLATGETDCWDSGRVENDRQVHVEYAGTPLRSRMACYWQVTVWDERGVSATSNPAFWSMGLLSPNDWQARWITHDPAIIRRDDDARAATSTSPGTPPLFRRKFDLPSSVHRATVYVTARGIVDLRINGAHVTEDRFVPEWTDYHRRLHFRTYDVTKMLVSGGNVLGATLGDGWWSGYIGWQETRGQYGTLENSLLVQLEIELEEGRSTTIVSDNSWRCETGPILSGDFMLGEVYDARRERTGWDKSAFDDSGWLPAVEVAAPKIRIPQYGFSNQRTRTTSEDLPLVAQRNEPVQVVEKIQPISVSEVSPGVYVYDLGQNIAGWVELTVEGSRGTRLQLRHAERLNPDGTAYTDNLRRADATDVYLLKGGGQERWQPRFTFHGFQYIELTGLDRPLPLEDIRGCVAMSSTPAAGDFECSHPLVNRLWQNALWGQKGNFLSVPTDCPQRDERLGWMGDAQVFLRTAIYNMDVAAFFTKWMTDVCDSQDVDGVFPDVAPRLDEGENFCGLDGLGGAAGWADAGVIVPWTIWQMAGDERIIRSHWQSMVGWIDWLEKTNPQGIRCNQLGNNYGDWLCIPSDTSFRTHSEMKTLLATAYWADDARKMAQMARAIGKPDESSRFDAMADRVRDRFQEKWLLEDGRLKVETQTAYLLALAFDLLPDEVRSQAADHLVDNIRQLGWRLSTGFIGISHLNPVLTLSGRADVAYRLLLNEEYPSWLYPVLHGATTIWERWNGWTEEDGFFDPQMNSFNHYSLGSVGEWLYRHVAGIELDPVAPGFQRLIIKPYLGGDLEFARARYVSMFGTIESYWKVEADSTELNVRIPPNSFARVFFPCIPNRVVKESGRPVAEAPGVDYQTHDGTYAVLDVQSGSYVFQVGD